MNHVNAIAGPDDVVAGAHAQHIVGRDGCGVVVLVIAVTQYDRVTIGAAIDEVVERCADDYLDSGEHIALGVATERGAGAGLDRCPTGIGRIAQIDLNAGLAALVVELVQPVAAIHGVGPGPADQDIIAGVSEQEVVALVP